MIDWDHDVDYDCPTCACCTEDHCRDHCREGGGDNLCRCWTDQPPEDDDV